MRHSNVRRQGLILLIVLGMLTLFSLLAISYVVFSGQSRSANFSLARRDFHGMKEAEVIDEAMKQILRGTVDNISAVGPHSLLADLYGHSESSSSNMGSLLFKARDTGRLFANRFLQIPLRLAAFPSRGETIDPDLIRELKEHDALTGRVLTFLQGPLSGVSFRVVRSLGKIDSQLDLQYSVVIDLDEAGPEGAGITAARAERLCFDTDGSVTGNITGYEMWINARELNGLGFGIPFNFAGQTLPTSAGGTPLNLLPGLHPSSTLPPNAPRGGQVGANNSRALMGKSTIPAPSDSDEASDAPDHNDFFLAHTRRTPTNTTPASLPSQDIIPSFHRAALVNYIVNQKDLTGSSFQPTDFINMLDDIQGACGRPLGISVTGLPNLPPYYSANRNFDGSNPGTAAATPVLTIDLGGNWNNWRSANSPQRQAFLDWAKILTAGPWDVDNDGDGVNDSVWVDIDLPLITSPEGKLLKMMAAYYIEDLDNRLDLNAVGNQSQTSGNDFIANTGMDRNYNLSGMDLPQGFGLGPAEATLRNLFTNDVEWQRYLDSRYGGNTVTFDGGNGTRHTPGRGTSVANFDDPRSQLNGGAQVYFGNPINGLRNAGTRSRRQVVSHDLLPGIPSAPRGDFAMGFDRMGNPLLLRGPFRPDQGTDDPYESSLMSAPHQDRPFTIAEWERIYRSRDWDRSTHPPRLEDFPSIANHIGAVTPRSAHTRHVPLAATSVPLPGVATVPQVTTFRELLNAIVQTRSTTQTLATPRTIDEDAYAELFPLEFKRAQAMDLNRPFGNGIDDNGNGSIDEPWETLTRNAAGVATPGLFSGSTLNVINAGLQQAPYIANNRVQFSGIPEFPVLSSMATLLPTPQDPAFFGYTYGNLDPEYEQLVRANDADARTKVNQHHGQQSRQLMARHLYCLAMLLLPDDLLIADRPTPTTADPEPRKLTGLDRSRAIAQWAVNVIDFRDADHAMTRFPFDPNPFVLKRFENAFGVLEKVYWLPNRDTFPLAIPNDPNDPPPLVPPGPTGYVVWGMEQPELLLTETGAMHDLRIKDTADDPSGKKSDDAAEPDDYDQYRIPQGSLFLEFMSLRTTGEFANESLPGTANSLYHTGSTNYRKLELSKVTPSDGETEYPVWRVAISEPHALNNNATPNDIANGTATANGEVPRQRVSYQLSAEGDAIYNGLAYDSALPGSPTKLPTPKIDRLVWFVNPLERPTTMDIAAAAVDLPLADTATAEKEARVYFNKRYTDANPLLLEGGQYLVVGPRETTNFGSKVGLAGALPKRDPNDHRIELTLTSNWADIYRIGSTTPVSKPLTHVARDVVLMHAVTSPPPSWNITGPPALDSWIGLNVSEPHPFDAVPPAVGYYPPPTHQLNSTDTKAIPTDPDGFGELPADAYYDYGDPQPGEFVKDTPFDSVAGRPIEDYYQKFFPRDAQSGVAAVGTKLDWCTAFLQRLADPDRPHHRTFNPYITVDWMPVDLTVFSGEDRVEEPTDYQFGFRSKNGSFDVSNTQQKRGRTFLSYLTDQPADAPPGTNLALYFSNELPVEDFAIPRTNGQNTNDTTLGFLNSAFAFITSPPPLPKFVDAPAITPATLQWNNRDFASPYELMLVPMSSPGQLMQEFSAPLSPADVANHNHYEYGADGKKHVNIFTHLPNFFQEARDSGSPASGLRRTYTLATLLELVTVPSQWSDADKIIPPGSFNYGDTSEVIMLGPLMPPYNRISQMREPGRVNVNTLEDVEVMRGLEWSYLATSDRNAPGNSWAFRPLKDSRHHANPPPPGPPGRDQIGGNTHLNSNYPTEFPGVFKSSLAAGLVVPTPGNLDAAAMQSPAQAGLLRQNYAGGANQRPLFSPRDNLMTDITGTNPQIEYLPISRLANLTTTRSNVFAVRITVGYFEFDTATGIGPEYGWDNGQSRRHRGFYVIDRSIPVAFEPGKDLNTANCVLLRRIVE